MAAEIPKKLLFLAAFFLIASHACADYCPYSSCSDAPQEPEPEQREIDFPSIIGRYMAEIVIFVFIFFIFAFLLYSMLYIPTQHGSSSLMPFIQTSKAFKRDFMRYGRKYKEKN